MKYRNKITNEVVEAKTYTENYVYKNNSNYEILVEDKKSTEKKKTSRDKKSTEIIEDEKSEEDEDKGQEDESNL